jgi:predicted ArsR family transcriptional regulator
MTERYPDHPGSKGPDGTSQLAAVEMARHAQPLRRRALETLNRIGPATALEVCEASKVAREAMHPRLSELRALGHVEPTGERRRNPSGKSAAALRLTDRGAAALRKEGGTAS